jgi:acyl-CoA thioester hydrolase
MPPPLPETVFRLPIRVYWEDTDAGGIVFYANYLKFFERARTEWLRALGHGQERLRAVEGIGFVVSETAVRYLRPARLDDVLEVTVAVQRAAQASLVLVQQAWRLPEGAEAATLLAEGTIRIGCVDLGTYRPVRIPNAILLSIR